MSSSGKKTDKYHHAPSVMGLVQGGLSYPTQGHIGSG